jgi:hypothetical protein
VTVISLQKKCDCYDDYERFKIFREIIYISKIRSSWHSADKEGQVYQLILFLMRLIPLNLMSNEPLKY